MTTTRLGRVARTISGSGFPLAEQGVAAGDLPFVKVSDLASPANCDRVVDAANWVTFDTADSLGARIVPPDSTIFPKVGAALLGNARGQSGVPVLIDNNMMAVVPTELDDRFVYWWLRSVDMGELSEGGALPFVSDSAVRDLRVPVNARGEQRRIADFLDDSVARIDQIISARRAQLASLDHLYAAWLGSFVDSLGEKHGWVALRRFDVSIEQGWSPEADSAPAALGQPGVLKLGAVRGGAFDAGQNKAFLEGTVPREELRIQHGDLLVTRANTPSLVGDAAVVEHVDADVYLSDLIYRLKTEHYGPLLASAALRTARSRQLISVIARGTSGSMPKLRGEDILGLPVPAAPVEHHGDLGNEDKRQRSERDRQAGELQTMLDLLTDFKQSLIAAAVTGEIDVTTSGSGIPG